MIQQHPTSVHISKQYQLSVWTDPHAVIETFSDLYQTLFFLSFTSFVTSRYPHTHPGRSLLWTKSGWFNATGALWLFKGVSESLRLSAVLIIPSLYDKPNRTKPSLWDTEDHLTKGYFKINVSYSLSVLDLKICPKSPLLQNFHVLLLAPIREAQKWNTTEITGLKLNMGSNKNTRLMWYELSFLLIVAQHSGILFTPVLCSFICKCTKWDTINNSQACH